VGAGAAGLSAAWYLRARGYRHVVVLEREARVGGKCNSFSCDGDQVDLGAFTATLDYRRVLEIARQVGAALCAQPPRLAVRWDTEPPEVTTILTALRERYSLWQIAAAGARYLTTLWHYRSMIDPPGFRQLARFPELARPFAEWARARGMAPLVDAFRLPVSDMGYGHMDHVPAAYVLKYMDLRNAITMVLYMLGLGFGWPKRLRDGYGRLWERVAWRLDVRTGVTITHVARGDEVVVRWTAADGAAGEARFDCLVLACPLDASEAFLDWTSQERRLYSQIRWEDYFVTACRIRGMPVETLDTMRDFEPGHPWEIMRPWPDSNVSVFYTPGAPGLTPARVVELIRHDVRRAFPRAEFVEVLRQVQWRYFPHVSGDAIAAGYYGDLEALQGRERTWVTGGLAGFETVENVVQYSHGLVERFFPPV
jgi:hypothetical protein